MPIVMVTFIQATFVLATFVQIRAVTDLILTKNFGANILRALIFVKTSTQRQLNNNSTKVGFDTKMTLQTTPPHPTTPPQKLNVRNISAVTDPDFDQALNVVSWDYLEQNLAVAVTFVQATFVLVTFVHIKIISAVTDPILMKL